jgi:hypothetical protein
LCALFAAPIAYLRQRAMLQRLLLGLAGVVVGFAVWVAGFAAANIRLLCRLF